MIKEILFDADGVVIKSRGKYFSQRLAEKQRIPLEAILPFIKTEYQLCVIGQAELKTVLPKYLALWGWTGTVDELLQFWFEGERDLDQNVLSIVDDLRKKGIKTGLATDNEEHRGRYLLDDLGLKTRFDNVFLSARMDVKKSNPEFFTQVLKTTNFKPEEIQYWDDDQKNVDIAKAIGIDARLFTTAKDLSAI